MLFILAGFVMVTLLGVSIVLALSMVLAWLDQR